MRQIVVLVYDSAAKTNRRLHTQSVVALRICRLLGHSCILCEGFGVIFNSQMKLQMKQTGGQRKDEDVWYLSPTEGVCNSDLTAKIRLKAARFPVSCPSFYGGQSSWVKQVATWIFHAIVDALLEAHSKPHAVRLLVLPGFIPDKFSPSRQPCEGRTPQVQSTQAAFLDLISS